MSALPPKADMCSATGDVCFGPIADMCGATRDVRFGPNATVVHRNNRAAHSIQILGATEKAALAIACN